VITLFYGNFFKCLIDCKQCFLPDSECRDDIPAETGRFKFEISCSHFNSNYMDLLKLPSKFLPQNGCRALRQRRCFAPGRKHLTVNGKILTGIYRSIHSSFILLIVLLGWTATAFSQVAKKLPALGGCVCS